MKIDGLLLRSISLELEALLEGRIQRVYQPDPLSLCLEIFTRANRPVLFISVDPQLPSIHLEDRVPAMASPRAFVMLLRKHLMGARISKIAQEGWDRALRLVLEGLSAGGDPAIWHLCLEIVGAATNLYLTDAEDKIMARLRPRLGRLDQGDIYVPPASGKVVFKTSEEVFRGEFLRRWQDVRPGDELHRAVFSLVDGLGPQSAREIVWQAGYLPEARVENLGDMMKTGRDLVQTCIEVLSSVAASRVTPVAARVSGKLLVSPFPLEHLGPVDWQSYPSTLVMVGDVFSKERELRQLHQIRHRLETVVRTALKRARRKLGNQLGDLKEAGDPDHLRQTGELLTAFMHQIRRGDRSVTVPDYTGGGRVTIPLDPSRTPSENAQERFRLYRKAQRTHQKAQRQVQKTQQEISYLESLELAIESGDTLEDMEDIAREMQRQGLLQAPRHRKEGARKRLPGKPSIQVFRSPSGYLIGVGKNNRQNDYLTFRWASGGDLWFHVKDLPGSHVVLMCSGDEPPAEDIEAAALVAAYYSKGRHGGNVPVDVTRVSEVKKPRGSPPGFVTYTGHRTLYVTPSRDLLPEPSEESHHP